VVIACIGHIGVSKGMLWIRTIIRDKTVFDLRRGEVFAIKAYFGWMIIGRNRHGTMGTC
jgi:hypothetical protein